MEGGLIALSSFGFGGANMHLVMDGHRAGQRLQVVTVDSGDTKRDNTIPLAARTADGLAYLARIIIEASPAAFECLHACTELLTACGFTALAAFRAPSLSSSLASAELVHAAAG